MPLAEIIALTQLGITTIASMVRDNRAQTTAEEDAALLAAHQRLVDAKARYDAKVRE